VKHVELGAQYYNKTSMKHIDHGKQRSVLYKVRQLYFVKHGEIKIISTETTPHHTTPHHTTPKTMGKSAVIEKKRMAN
jgi:hypothetical protein